MKITANVKVINNDTTLKGIADLGFDNEFVVRGIRIIETEKGLFVSMPSKKVGDEYKQDCFPITAECRERLNKTVLDAYEQKQNQTEEQKNAQGANVNNKQSEASSQLQEEDDGLKNGNIGMSM